MVDLIIPVYNNREGLLRSLMSIGTELADKLLVTVVDDGSTEDYNDLIDFFAKCFPIRLLKLEKNSGPGVARQYGLDRATQKWVTFLDCGDTFLTSTTLLEMFYTCEANDDLWMASWQHQEELWDQSEGHVLPYAYDIVDADHNRMHGKMYRLSFLRQYNIGFSLTTPRHNEDIGFNLAGRLICKNETLKDGINHLYEFNAPAVVWKVSGPSIVRKNDCEFFYHFQNMGMARNSIHALTIARNAGVDINLIIREIYSSMVVMYFFCLITKKNRPEYYEDTLKGAFYYYVKMFRDVRDFDKQTLNECYWEQMRIHVIAQSPPFEGEIIALDFIKFIDELEESFQKITETNDNEEKIDNMELLEEKELTPDEALFKIDL